jgi:hypothetical protein
VGLSMGMKDHLEAKPIPSDICHLVRGIDQSFPGTFIEAIRRRRFARKSVRP